MRASQPRHHEPRSNRPASVSWSKCVRNASNNPEYRVLAGCNDRPYYATSLWEHAVTIKKDEGKEGKSCKTLRRLSVTDRELMRHVTELIDARKILNSADIESCVK